MQNNRCLDVRSGIKFVKDLKAEGYTIKMLVIMVGEVYDKHKNNEKLTQLERFVIGLRYSEFLAVNSTDIGYFQAEVKRKEYLKSFNIDVNEFSDLCVSLCGLR